MEVALELEHVAKTYKTHVSGWKKVPRKAVVDVSLTVPAGTVFGLLGPNGAGKTTTIKMAIGFLQPDSGRVQIFGESNSPRARARIGFLPEQPYFYPHLSVERALDFYAQLFSIKKPERRDKVDRLLALVGLSDAAKLPISKLSKGMLQRFGIAQALINDPDLLIVDEPASGLDPIGQVEMRRILTTLNAEGKSILLSSHYLSEVENICHEVAVINKGTVIARGAIGELLDAGGMYTVRALNLPKSWRPLAQAVKIENGDGVFRLTVPQGDLVRTIDGIRSSGGFIDDVRRANKSLEQLFMELVGGDADGN